MSYKGVSARSTANNIILQRLPVMSDKTVLVFSDMGNAYRVNLDDFACKLSDKGFMLADVFDDAAETERAVAFFEENDAEGGELLFITAGGMLKRTAFAEYSLNKKVYQAIRLIHLYLDANDIYWQYSYSILLA